MGWFSLHLQQNVKLIKYLIQLETQNKNHLAKQSYRMLKYLYTCCSTAWPNSVQIVLDDYELGEYFMITTLNRDNYDILLRCFKDTLRNTYEDNCYKINITK